MEKWNDDYLNGWMVSRTWGVSPNGVRVVNADECRRMLFELRDGYEALLEEIRRQHEEQGAMFLVMKEAAASYYREVQGLREDLELVRGTVSLQAALIDVYKEGKG